MLHRRVIRSVRLKCKWHLLRKCIGYALQLNGPRKLSPANLRATSVPPKFAGLRSQLYRFPRREPRARNSRYIITASSYHRKQGHRFSAAWVNLRTRDFRFRRQYRTDRIGRYVGRRAERPEITFRSDIRSKSADVCPWVLITIYLLISFSLFIAENIETSKLVLTLDLVDARRGPVRAEISDERSREMYCG